MKALTLKDYSDMTLAMYERDEEAKESIRQLRVDIINLAPGVTKKYTAAQILPIPIIDNANIILHIKNIEQALRLLKEFK